MTEKLRFLIGSVLMITVFTTPSPLCGQGVSDSVFFAQMDSLYASNQGEKAIQLTQAAQPKFQLQEKWEAYIKCFNQVARFLEEAPDPIERKSMLRQAIEEGTPLLGPDHFLIGDAYQQKGELFIGLEQYDSAFFYLDKAILIFEKNKKLESHCWAIIIKAVSHYQLSDFQAAKASLLAALAIVEKHPTLNPDVSNTIFQILSAIYLQTGAYDKSLESALQAVNIFLTDTEFDYSDSVRLANMYNSLGSIYVERKDYEQAIRYYKIALNLCLKTEAIPSDIVLYNNCIGYGLRHMGQYEAAHSYFQNSLNVLQNHPNACTYKDTIETYIYLSGNQLELGNPFKSIQTSLYLYPLILRYKYLEIEYYYNLGNAYEDQHEWDKAIFYYKKAQNSSPLHTNNYQVMYTKILQRLGEVYTRLDSLDQALTAFQQALAYLKPAFSPNSSFDNPTLNGFSAYSLLLPILDAKAQALTKKYTGDITSLTKILPTYRLAAEVIEYIRQGQVSEASKLLLSTHARTIYDGAIGLLYQLYQVSGDPAYMEEAFQYMEKGKSLVLLEGIRAYKAMQTDLQPAVATDSVFQQLLQQEKQLKLDRVFYEQKLAEAQQQKDTLKIHTLENTLAETYAAEQVLQTQLKQQYPAYHQVNSSYEVVTIDQVQTAILGHDPSKALLEYYLGGDVIYVIRITSAEAQFFQLPYPEAFDQLILTYRKSLRGYAADNSESGHFQSFVQAAHQLYQGLMAPVVEGMPADAEQLYVITDGKLGYISFESLLTSLEEMDEINYSLNTLHYVIEDWMISYGYSSTLLLENGQKVATKRHLRSYGGFAPVYDQHAVVAERSCESGQPLGALPSTEESVQSLQALLGGKQYLRAKASKENFLADAAKFQILHLSTHACVDDQNPLFNRIFFAQEYLPTYEVYNMHLNANLVVLSACETGFGELSKGEGIMSLARSFMYAGSQSVVTSLWNANDQATTQIMIDFHTYLHEGLSKAAALHQAKLDYLAKAPSRRSSPYYWSNFVLIGDTQAIEFGGILGMNFWLIIGASLLLGIIAFVLINRRKG